MVDNFRPFSRENTKQSLVEHPLRSSTKIVNLVSDLVDLYCLASFL